MQHHLTEFSTSCSAKANTSGKSHTNEIQSVHTNEIQSDYILISGKILRKEARRHVFFHSYFSVYFSPVTKYTQNVIAACKTHYQF